MDTLAPTYTNMHTQNENAMSCLIKQTDLKQPAQTGSDEKGRASQCPSGQPVHFHKQAYKTPIDSNGQCLTIHHAAILRHPRDSDRQWPTRLGLPYTLQYGCLKLMTGEHANKTQSILHTHREQSRATNENKTCVSSQTLRDCRQKGGDGCW